MRQTSTVASKLFQLALISLVLSLTGCGVKEKNDSQTHKQSGEVKYKANGMDVAGHTIFPPQSGKVIYTTPFKFTPNLKLTKLNHLENDDVEVISQDEKGFEWRTKREMVEVLSSDREFQWQAEGVRWDGGR